MEKNTIVIVDGNSLINRAYFAMSELRNSKGIYTGGIHGLVSMILNLKNQFSPTHFCVAFDMKGPTFRHLTYEAYKGTRKGMPEELAMQMPIAKELLDVLGITRVELQGFEADDLIGTIAKRCQDEGFDVHVVTGDKDALQLVAHGVKVHITKKGISVLNDYDDAAVFEELGVHANQVIDFKGLSGDTSDNIPGIPGVGPKTAAKFLEQFQTVENLIQNASEISNKRHRELVEQYAEQALLSKRLATICLDVPLDLEMNQLLLQTPDYSKVMDRFSYYELKSLLQKFQAETKEEAPPQISVAYQTISGKALCPLLEKTSHFTFKILTDYDWKEEHKEAVAFVRLGDDIYILEALEELVALKDIFENAHILKYGYDMKRDYLILKSLGISPFGMVFDSYIASYVVEPSAKTYALADLAEQYLGKTLESEESLLGKGAKKIKILDLPLEKLYGYGSLMVSLMAEMVTPLTEKLNELESMSLFNEIEMPLVSVLAEVEFVGFKVDESELDTLDVALTEQIQNIEAHIYELSGKAFNINSPKQLGEVLFEDLGLKSGKKTKTGYSTSHDVLEKMVHEHPIIEDIMEYRTYSKLKSTYIDGLRPVIQQKTSRIHTSLNQTVAATGRLSSTEPNLQNIPIRLAFGRKIRKFFVADPDCVLLSADYSQIELRVLAHLSKDPTLIHAFMNDIDIHALTASQVFGVEVGQVTSAQRSHAKEVNFGIVYGMGDFGLSESLSITRKEAKQYIEGYFKTYPRVQDFMNEIIDSCKEKGYVSTIFGRTRQVPEINHSNFMVRSGAERIARNTPIQGSAADIIKIAMIKVEKELREKGFKSRMILQVHDELILNVPKEELEAVTVLLKDCMENACQLEVPLNVDVHSGGNWYEVK